MRLIADLLSMQDPAKPHTLLTRAIVSAIIVGSNLVYAGFFGVLGAVAVYLIGIELMSADLRWMYAPVGLSFLVGLRMSMRSLADYWRRHGNG